MTTRVAVIGLGSTGAMAAWQLSLQPETEVIGLEQFGVGHGYEAFTGESRLFRTAYHEGPTYVPLLLRARELWEQLGGLSRRTLLHSFGALSVGAEDEAPFQRTLTPVRDYHLPALVLGADELRCRYPGMDIRDDEMGIFDRLGGALRPELAVMSAIEQARKNGATILDHEEVLNIEDTGDKVIVTTAGRTVEADRVVVTTGGWIEHLMPQISSLVEVRKLVLTWFLPRVMSDFDPSLLPCFLRDRDGFHIFGAPSVDSYSVKIAGLDLWGGKETPRIEDADLRLDRDEVSRFGEKVVDLFPGVQAEPNRFSVHFDTYTQSKDPIIDRVGNVTIATGFSGHGFKMAPAVGEILAGLALHGTATHWDDKFAIGNHEPYDSEMAGHAAGTTADEREQGAAYAVQLHE